MKNTKLLFILLTLTLGSQVDPEWDNLDVAEVGDLDEQPTTPP